jgi:predicted GNAT family acetyltransferase
MAVLMTRHLRYATTFAAFLTRAHDFIRMAAVSDITMALCGTHSGVEIGADGPSRMGVEDLARCAPCVAPPSSIPAMAHTGGPGPLTKKRLRRSLKSQRLGEPAHRPPWRQRTGMRCADIANTSMRTIQSIYCRSEWPRRPDGARTDTGTTMAEKLWADASDSIAVFRDDGSRYYEVQENGEYAGLLAYESKGNHYSLTHTFVQEGRRGRGLGTALIRVALSDLKNKGATVTNWCPVVDRFVEGHPEFHEVVDRGSHTTDEARS